MKDEKFRVINASYSKCPWKSGLFVQIMETILAAQIEGENAIMFKSPWELMPEVKDLFMSLGFVFYVDHPAEEMLIIWKNRKEPANV